MAETFLGEIIAVGFTYAPRGFALCNGQILSISQNTALFALLGTTYGGDGKATFALPDLQCRVPLNAGNGVGLAPHPLGEKAGAESFTLNANQLPAHTHSLNARAVAGDRRTPGGSSLAIEAADQTAIYSSDAPNVAMNALSIGASGGGAQPVNALPPFLVINFAIALQGIFPSRP